MLFNTLFQTHISFILLSIQNAKVSTGFLIKNFAVDLHSLVLNIKIETSKQIFSHNFINFEPFLRQLIQQAQILNQKTPFPHLARPSQNHQNLLLLLPRKLNFKPINNRVQILRIFKMLTIRIRIKPLYNRLIIANLLLTDLMCFIQILFHFLLNISLQLLISSHFLQRI